MHSLKRSLIIQKSTAIFLALLFLISTAPKAYFHDLLAHHKDFSDCRQLHHSTVLHQQGINCHFDDLVVTAPFIVTTQQPIAELSLDFKKQHSLFYSSFPQSVWFHKENRGPPSN